nr:Protein C26B2.7 [Haemonchus contortus]
MLKHGQIFGCLFKSSMLVVTSRTLRRNFISQRTTLRLSSVKEKVVEPGNEATVKSSPLRRGPDERDITTMDLLEERIRQRSSLRTSNFGGQQQSWNYRSEVVGKLGLDNKHKNIWIAYVVIIAFGFTAFVYVKSNVVLSRKEQMEERERMRRELKLHGADRKRLARLVENADVRALKTCRFTNYEYDLRDSPAETSYLSKRQGSYVGCYPDRDYKFRWKKLLTLGDWQNAAASKQLRYVDTVANPRNLFLLRSPNQRFVTAERGRNRTGNRVADDRYEALSKVHVAEEDVHWDRDRYPDQEWYIAAGQKGHNTPGYGETEEDDSEIT